MVIMRRGEYMDKRYEYLHKELVAMKDTLESYKHYFETNGIIFDVDVEMKWKSEDYMFNILVYGVEKYTNLSDREAIWTIHHLYVGADMAMNQLKGEK